MNEASEAEKLAAMLKANHNKKILLHTGKGAENGAQFMRNCEITENVNKNWSEYDIVIYTSTIEAGVLFEESHFDYICGSFGSRSTIHDSVFQSLMRCRKPKENTLFIAIEGDKELIPFDRSEVIKIAEAKLQCGRLHELDKKIKYVYDSSAGFLRDWDDPFYFTLAENHCYSMWSRKCLRKLVKREFQYAGAEWIERDFDCNGDLENILKNKKIAGQLVDKKEIKAVMESANEHYEYLNKRLTKFFGEISEAKLAELQHKYRNLTKCVEALETGVRVKAPELTGIDERDAKIIDIRKTFEKNMCQGEMEEQLKEYLKKNVETLNLFFKADKRNWKKPEDFTCFKKMLEYINPILKLSNFELKLIGKRGRNSSMNCYGIKEIK